VSGKNLLIRKLPGLQTVSRVTYVLVLIFY